MKKKPKLTVYFIIGLSLILVSSFSVLTFVALDLVRNLGNYAITVDKDNSEILSGRLFLDLTRATAEDISDKFKSTATQLELFAVHCLGRLSHRHHPKYNPQEFDFKKYPSIDSTSYFLQNRNFDLLYFSPKKEFSQQNIGVQIESFSSLLPISQKAINRKNLLLKAVWIASRDNVYFYYPALLTQMLLKEKKAIKTAPITKLYPYFLKQFPLKSKDPDGVFPVRIFPPFRDLFFNFRTLYFMTSIYDDNHKLLAYISFTLDFDKIEDFMTRRHVYSSETLHADENNTTIEGKESLIRGFTFLLDRNNCLLVFPKKYRKEFDVNKEKIIPLYTTPNERIKLTDLKNPEMQRLGKAIEKKDTGVVGITINNRVYTVAFAKIKTSNWTLGYIVNQESLLSPIAATKGKVREIEKQLSSKFLWVSFFSLLIACIMASIFYRHFILFPIRKIMSGIKKISQGNFNVSIKDMNTAETVKLASQFNYMSEQLKKYTEDLKAETITRQEIESEIKIASEIQRTILPNPACLPKNDKFDLTAKIDAAKNVSGDFYDFFYLDKDNIVVLIADVSGKGLQAAFFMAMAKVLIKNQALFEHDPGKVLEKANKMLCMDNSAQMFVTVFLAFYCISDGTIHYANAGHHNAILIANDRDNVRLTEKHHNIALGVVDNLKIKTGTARLEIGETCIQYTDGVTEAVSPENEEYGEERLIKLLLENKNMTLDKITDEILKDVQIFENKNRFDDITIVAFKRLK